MEKMALWLHLKEKRVLMSYKYIIEAFTYEIIECLGGCREKWGEKIFLMAIDW